MWDTIVAVMIVGAAIFLTVRSLARCLRGKGNGQCGGGCSGCPRGGDGPPDRLVKPQ